MISDPKALEDLVGEILTFPRVAIDTEADSLHCYFEKVCLIQLSGGSGHWLVDPLANLDLQPLLEAVCSRRLVFHGADYDLRLLRRIGNFEPVDLFDDKPRRVSEPVVGHQTRWRPAAVQGHSTSRPPRSEREHTTSKRSIR